MKVQLRLVYGDGGKCKVTNTRGNVDYLLSYLKRCNYRSLEQAGIYIYPLKDNTPIIIVKDGKVVNNVPGWNIQIEGGSTNA